MSDGIVAHNARFYGEDIAALARHLGVEVAALLAVATTEVGRIAHPGLGAPVMRFEVHAFLRRVKTSKVVQLRTHGPDGSKLTAWHKDAHWYKSDPDDDWQRVHSGSQGDEYAAMIQAQSESPVDAWECASYGVGQLMGWHWKLLGVKSVQRMVGQATGGGVPAQIKQWGAYIENDKSGEMHLALRLQDWEAFVRMYNGSGQVSYYTGAMMKRYEEAVVVLSQPLPSAEEIDLATWTDRQQALVDLGYGIWLEPWGVDGSFGDATRRAIKAFQNDYGLNPDGAWGRYTEEHVRNALMKEAA